MGALTKEDVVISEIVGAGAVVAEKAPVALRSGIGPTPVDVGLSVRAVGVVQGREGV